MTDTTVVQALNAVMRQIGVVRKTDRNTQGTGYNFRGIDAVTNAVYPAFCDHGVLCVPRVLTYEYGTVVVGNRRTEMSHARLTVEFTFHGPAGDTIVASAAGEAFDSGDKATAKAHSVALRTALLQTLMLPTGEADPDAATYERSAPVSEEQRALAELEVMCNSNGLDTRAVAKRFTAEIGGDINAADAPSIRAYAAVLAAEIEAAGR
jgi:ERF superfamily